MQDIDAYFPSQPEVMESKVQIQKLIAQSKSMQCMQIQAYLLSI